jgi:uncharacterized protein (TIRG00374 family)
MKSYKKILPLFSIALLVILLYFSDLPRVVDVLLKTDMFLILITLVILTASVFLRIVRWKLFLKNLNIDSTWSECSYSYMPALFLSNFTPARIGEPIRSYFLKKMKGVSMSKTIPSVIVERAMDVTSLVILGVFILFTFNLGYMVYVDVVLVILIIVVGIALLRNERIAGRIFGLFFRIFSFHSRLKEAGKRKEEITGRFHSGFRIKKSILSFVFVLSLLIWVSEGVIFYLAFLSIGVSLPLFLITSIFAFSILMGVITFLPGGIGSTEFVFALVLSSYIPLSQATAGIMLGRFLTFWIIMFIASLFWRKI